MEHWSFGLDAIEAAWAGYGQPVSFELGSWQRSPKTTKAGGVEGPGRDWKQTY
jgi:hypothetical protein